MDSARPAPTLVPGRSCDGCAMCCKLLAIPPLDKPAGTWCQFCTDNRSCGNYEARPIDCRVYYCEYLKQDWIGEEWKPSHSRMIIAPADNGKRLIVLVDPARADAWKKEPYYSTIKRWSASALEKGNQVVVTVGPRHVVIYPQHDIDLGNIADDECIVFGESQTPSGPVPDARKIKRSDEHLYRRP